MPPLHCQLILESADSQSTLNSVLKVAKFNASSAVTKTSRCKYSLCLMSWDQQIFHYLLHQEVSVQNIFAKPTQGIGFSKRARVTSKIQPEDNRCPLSQLSDHRSGLEHVVYLFCLRDSNSYHSSLSLLLLRLFHLYQEKSLFIKSEKRQRH